MTDLFSIDDFFDPEMVAELTAEMRVDRGEAATVYGKEAGGAVEVSVRKVTRVVVSTETQQRVMNSLTARLSEIGAHFGEALNECEAPQFLRYQPGDYFIPHQDGNTPLIRDDSRRRKISLVIFLSPQSDELGAHGYAGGSLTLHGSYPNYDTRFIVPNNPGTLVAFRAETTHEVTPVTHGERLTIVSWYR
jgi:SM-20-related protein